MGQIWVDPLFHVPKKPLFILVLYFEFEHVNRSESSIDTMVYHVYEEDNSLEVDLTNKEYKLHNIGIWVSLF